MSRLPAAQFLQALELVPLISFDLIVHSPDKGFLVGLRKNEPAKGSYFVPGGAIIKNEKLDEAFFRISQTELGVGFCRVGQQFLGLYEHFWPNINFLGKDGIDTHYIVLAYHVLLEQNEQLSLTEDDQHIDFKWMSRQELLKSEDVHPTTKRYFENPILSL